MFYQPSEELTNRPDCFMVCTLIDHRNDAIKCSKLKWNYEPQASGFLPNFEHFMALFLWSIRELTMKNLVDSFFKHEKLYAELAFFFCCKIVNTKHARIALQIVSFSRSIVTLINHTPEPISL